MSEGGGEGALHGVTWPLMPHDSQETELNVKPSKWEWELLRSVAPFRHRLRAAAACRAAGPRRGGVWGPDPEKRDAREMPESGFSIKKTTPLIITRPQPLALYEAEGGR